MRGYIKNWLRKVKMKFAIVTNIPAPYRIPIYNILAEKYGDNFLVIYCARKEANRSWNLDDFRFNHTYLKEKTKAKGDGFNFVHNNPDIFKKLRSFKPDVVITTGYNPTHLYAWFYALLNGKKHIPMTDGWQGSERNLSFLHRLVRRLVFFTSKAFIGAGENSIRLFGSYGVKRERIFKSHLCIDNERFMRRGEERERNHHLMFSGQFLDIKLPFLFAEICKKVKESIPELKVLLLGSGPLKEEFLGRLDEYGIDYDYPGFISQEELPGYYSSSKLFLFTTITDAWGIVANEAMASGMPVLVTPHAGVVNDLVLDGENGFILEAKPELWAERAVELLTDSEMYKSFSERARERVVEFNFQAAAEGISQAFEYAIGAKKADKEKKNS